MTHEPAAIMDDRAGPCSRVRVIQHTRDASQVSMRIPESPTHMDEVSERALSADLIPSSQEDRSCVVAKVLSHPARVGRKSLRRQSRVTSCGSAAGDAHPAAIQPSLTESPIGCSGG